VLKNIMSVERQAWRFATTYKTQQATEGGEMSCQDTIVSVIGTTRRDASTCNSPQRFRDQKYNKNKRICFLHTRWRGIAYQFQVDVPSAALSIAHLSRVCDLQHWSSSIHPSLMFVRLRENC
jgi:hypothetical protein